MFDLRTTLLEYTAATSHKLTELDNGKFAVDLEFPMKDDKKRYQMVWCWQIEGRARGKDVIYFTSRAGIYNPGLNINQLMKESGFGTYSTITIVSDKDKAGNPCESIVVQASPVVDFLSKEEFLYILLEVGEVADILEDKHFGGDSN